MSHKLFDNFLKDKLGQYDSGAPMHVWERIREKEKDDKKTFFWWKKYFLVGIVLLSLSALGYLVWQSVSSEINTTGHQNSTNALVNNNQPATTENSSTSVSTEDQDMNTNTKTNENITAQQTQGALTKPVQNNNDNNETNQPASVRGTLANNVTIISQTRKTGNSLKGNIQLSKKEIKDGDAAISGNQQQSFSGSAKKKNTILQTKKKDLVNPYSISLAGNEYERRPFTFKFQTGNVAQPNNKPTCPTINGPRRNDWYLEVYGSPDYTLRSFSNPALFNNYVSYRKTNEDNRNGFSAGLRIAKNFGEKTVVKAGVNYSQINERLKLISQNEKQFTQIITIRTVIRAPGDTLFIRDTSYFEQTGTRYRTTYNRYRFIDIPVLFSYEFGNPEIVAFAVNAGPVFNISSFYRGEVLDTFLRPVKISTNSGSGVNNWRSNIGIGMYTSFSVYKHVNSRLQIFAEPYFRYNFRPVSQNTGIVNQRYSISGMQLGIRYKLNSTRQRYRY